MVRKYELLSFTISYSASPMNSLKLGDTNLHYLDVDALVYNIRSWTFAVFSP